MSRPHRLSSTEYLGPRLYFVTICTYQRSRPFTAGQVVADVSTQFLQTATSEQCAITAYCFMPDHIHALVSTLTANADFHRFVRLAKQRTGFNHQRKTGQRLWQESFFDRTLRDDESPVTVMNYIIRNPVRAGLAVTPQEYPHWGSQAYTREEVLDFIEIESRSCRRV